MSKKKKDPVIKDYEKLKAEIVIDKVNEIFRTQPDNYISALEETGFEYHEEDDYDEIEEKNAEPENQNQKDLVTFFKGEKKLSDRILHQYFEECDSEFPNQPLIRPFFKAANQNLKSLILCWSLVKKKCAILRLWRHFGDWGFVSRQAPGCGWY